MSREIDVLIATEVMGYSLAEGPYAYSGLIVNGKEAIPRPKYSTDIAAAWEVFAGIAGTHTIGMESHRDRGVIWLCLDRAFFKYNWADTAPMVICLAALRAKGVDIKNERKIPKGTL